MMRVLRGTLLGFLAASLAVVLAACSGGGGGGGVSLVDSVVVVHISSGAGLRGLTMTMVLRSDFTAVGVSEVDAPLTGATCQTNITSDQVLAACVTTVTFAAPLDAWSVTLRHAEGVDPLDGVTSLDCEGSDAGGNTFAVSCVAQ